MQHAPQSRVFAFVLLAAAAAISALTATDAAAAYATTTRARALDILPPTQGETVANDMNAAGQVAAVIENKQGRLRGVLFEQGRLIELGSLGGKDSEAKRINDKGEIIGSANRRDGTWRAFLYDRAGGMHELGTLGGPSSNGTAINNSGAAVGFADLANGEWHAFLYQPGHEEMQDLGTLGGKISYASGINSKGQVAGTAALANGYRHAFLCDPADPARGMVDLGTLGGRSSTATAINDDGMVVGASEMPNRRWHAFLYDGKRMTDLGAIIGSGDSFATGINNAGHVVGSVVYADDRMSFVWHDGRMALHFAGKSLYVVNAINNGEQVIGATYDHGLHAATMLSSAVPFVDRGGTRLFSLIVTVLVLAGLAVLYRKRYRGILLAHIS